MRQIEEREVRTAARRAGQDHLRRARRLGARRPELVAYLVAATQRSSKEARAAAWSGLEIIVEAMGAAIGEERATMERVLEVHDENLEFAIGVGMCEPRIAARYLSHTPALKQRALLKRLSDGVVEAAPPGERGALFLILKTVVDILDETAPANTSRASSES